MQPTFRPGEYWWKYYIRGELAGYAGTCASRKYAKRMRKEMAQGGMTPGRMHYQPK